MATEERTAVLATTRSMRARVRRLLRELEAASEPCRVRWRGMRQFYRRIGGFSWFATSEVRTWEFGEHRSCMFCQSAAFDARDAALLHALDALAKAGDDLHDGHIDVACMAWAHELTAVCTTPDGRTILHSVEFGVRSGVDGATFTSVFRMGPMRDESPVPHVCIVDAHAIGSGRTAVCQLAFMPDPIVNGALPPPWQWVINRIGIGFACAMLLRDFARHVSQA